MECKNILKDIISNENYVELKNLELSGALEEILTSDALISISEDDIKEVVNGKLKGYYYGAIKNLKLTILDNHANNLLFVTLGDEKMSLRENENAMNKVREIYPNAKVTFGTIMNPKLIDHMVFIIAY